MSFNFIFSGPFGSGKTITSLSFLPNGKKYGDPVRRLVFDMELRCGIYKSQDDKDHPSRPTFHFEPVHSGGRVTGEVIYAIMAKTRTGQWKDNIVPDMICIDDIAQWQKNFFEWLDDKTNAEKVAKLYNMNKVRLFTSDTWKPYDAGAISVFKDFISEWMIDMRAHNITFVGNTVLHNVWQNYGARGLAQDGLPKMRVLGKSAKMLDAFQKMTDVVWIFDREIPNPEGKGIKLKTLPTVKMDLFTPKASLPGIPEQFEWPGWTTIWNWHNERKYVADLSKLAAAEPGFDQDSIDLIIKKTKHKLAVELKDVCTPEQIKKALSDEFAPVFSYEVATNEEEYQVFKKWIVEKVASQKTDNANSVEPDQAENSG